jgi:hypothetical protein
MNGCANQTEEADLRTLPINEISSEIGFCYLAQTGHLELGAHKKPSSAVMLENGRPLPGPANALHEDIRRLGEGRYCFWHDLVYFSTSDRSDPRTNGRIYSVAFKASTGTVVATIVPASVTRFVTGIAARLSGVAERAGVLSVLRRLRNFSSKWKGRLSRRMAKLRLTPILWGSFYWLCFGMVLLRGTIKKDLREPRRES